MVLLYFPFFTVFLPLAVTALAVQIVRPWGGVDGVDQVVFPEALDVVLVINGSGMAVVLKENVSDERMVVCVMYAQSEITLNPFILIRRYRLRIVYPIPQSGSSTSRLQIFFQE